MKMTKIAYVLALVWLTQGQMAAAAGPAAAAASKALKKAVEVATGLAKAAIPVAHAPGAEAGPGTATTVGNFDSKVEVGSVEQRTNGQNNQQDLSVGSVERSKVDGKFFADVEVRGNIVQESMGGGSNNKQNMAVGSVQDSEVQDFEAKRVITGNLTQSIKSGSNVEQDMAIGAVRQGSDIDGKFTTDVSVRDVTQTATDAKSQKIEIGSASNTKVLGDFTSTVAVTGNISQTANGKGISQDLMLGSARNATLGTFKSDVTVNGGITQNASGSGHTQNATLGSVR